MKVLCSQLADAKGKKKLHILSSILFCMLNFTKVDLLCNFFCEKVNA